MSLRRSNPLSPLWTVPFLCLMSTGCQTVGPSFEPSSPALGSNRSDQTGQTRQVFAASRLALEEAVIQAMNAEGIRFDKAIDLDPNSTTLIGRSPSGNRAEVRLVERRGTTEVFVKVGQFGQERRASTLLNRIGQQLDPNLSEPANSVERSGIFSREAVPDDIMFKSMNPSASGTPGISGTMIPY